jgi:hypothetical protein
MPVNFTGTWQTDLTRSKLRGPAPRSIVVTIAHSDPDLRQEVVVTRSDGNQDRQVFTCSTNGEPDRAQLNGKPIRGTARWVSNELLIETRMHAGPRELHFRDFWSLSPDGQTLFAEHRDDDLAGQLAILKRAG